MKEISISSSNWGRIAAFAAVMVLPAAAGASGSIRVGASIPLSGSLGGEDGAILSGANALLAAVNASGGVYGRKIELVALDDGCDVKRTVENTRRLVTQEHVFARSVTQAPHRRSRPTRSLVELSILSSGDRMTR